MSSEKPELNKASTADKQQLESEFVTQLNSPLHALPTGVMLHILSMLSNKERMCIAQTCKEMLGLADGNSIWKIVYERQVGKQIKNDATNYKHEYKKLLKFTDSKEEYYIVGHSINNIEKSLFDLYPKYRSNISKEEMINSFPAKNTTVKVFASAEDAQVYAKSQQQIKGHLIAITHAIFTVSMRPGIHIENKQETVQKSGMARILPTREKEAHQVTFFETKVENVRVIKQARLATKKEEVNVSNPFPLGQDKSR